MKILITGAAGFIGYHVCKRLICENIEVIGIDNLNNYYDVKLKEDRINDLIKTSKSNENLFSFFKEDLVDKNNLENIFKNFQIEKVINLAAQAGVRYSIENPDAYIQSNLVGFGNILECCRSFKIKHLVYASSSSVYGGNEKLPFSESDSVDHPVSLYAATKKANELMAHSYSSLYKLPTTGLRFFTVYGPWGRPDMALFLFTKAILEKKKINVFNHGNMIRDFTYVEDIVESLIRVLNKPPLEDPLFDKKNPSLGSSWAPYKVFNIGNSDPVELIKYIEAVEDSLGVKAVKNYLPMQKGDVPSTAADTSSLEKWIDFKPETKVKEGVNKFVEWYISYTQNK